MKAVLTIAAILSLYALKSQELAKEVLKDSITDAEWRIAVKKPSKVAFYSAILPGLGQVHNKKYWKVPIVYLALGTSAYFYIFNDRKYQEFRTLFKQKKLDESATDLTFDYLQRAQKYHRKKRDGDMLLLVGAYLLQIVEASVDAHLQYHSTDSILSFKPQLIRESMSGDTKIAASFTFKF